MDSIWPINMPPGPAFLAVYAVMFLAAAGIGWFLGRLRFMPRPPGAPPPGEDPYRNVEARPELLRVGSFPNEDDRYAVAYLRNGRDGVREALLGAAVAHGILSSTPKAGLDLVPSGRSDLPAGVLADFHRELEATANLSAAALYRAADVIITARQPQLEARLLESGLLLPRKVATRKAALLAVCGAGVLVLGILRWVRAVELSHPAGFLLLELIASCGLLFAWTKRLATRPVPSGEGRRYLGWLTDVTSSLRQEVEAGHRTSPEEIAIAVALGGIQAVAALRESPVLRAAVKSSSFGGGPGSRSGGGFGGSCGAGWGGGCGGGGGGGGGCGG